MPCTGCGRTADRLIKNTTLEICTPCTKLLPLLATKHISGFEPRYCPECDERLWHGQLYCISCVEDAIEYVHAIEPGLCDDNIFIYEMLLPNIRFHQGLHLADPAGCPRSEFWHDIRIGDSLESISFEGIRKSEGMLARLPPRKCDCCGSSEQRAQLYVCDSFESEFLWCEECRQTLARYLTTQGMSDHPMVRMLLATDESESTVDIWHASLYEPSNSFGVSRFRVQKIV